MPSALIIDDESMVRLALRQMLERQGFDILEASDGEEGLRLFATRPVELVVCDLIMPRSDGISTIMNIRRISSRVKIIAISGGGRSHALELLNVAEQMGADHILEKPFTRIQLLDAISHCLPRVSTGASQAG
ncbi:response regulator [Azospirillum sp. RWY-5-1]|uniref:Response regulator n=1 Tax=Azospirillum oleiclasticum TaxID=2735135 RepID=A0ABX2T9C7_9PROT|nr:response regulator [Azospirillum oleiclasticum]NYZ12135.1 response regulator [Azospirillum oleiclasticum]NYZ19295.1 response regulator [Azospirillum oleiclasticum]